MKDLELLKVTGEIIITIITLIPVYITIVVEAFTFFMTRVVGGNPPLYLQPSIWIENITGNCIWIRTSHTNIIPTSARNSHRGKEKRWIGIK